MVTEENLETLLVASLLFDLRQFQLTHKFISAGSKSPVNDMGGVVVRCEYSSFHQPIVVL